MKIFERTSRKASLNLSINAIVVLILAITMLGLGLGFIRTMFKGATSKLSGAIETTSLKNPADSTTPLTIDRQITVKASKSERIELGFYNTYTQPVASVFINLDDNGCLGDITLDADAVTLKALASSEVKAGEGTGFNAILGVKGGTTPGTYICQIKAFTGAAGATGLADQTAQFFLEIIG